MNKVSEERMKLRIEYSRETDLIFSDNIPAYADWLENKLALRQPPVTCRLNQLKDKGYHRRFSGSMFMSDSWVNCDCCGRKTKVKIGYEADYPKNPDMGLCSMCSDELIDLYGT